MVSYFANRNLKKIREIRHRFRLGLFRIGFWYRIGSAHSIWGSCGLVSAQHLPL
jgi:hypothetical protein